MSEEMLFHCLSLSEWIKVTSILSYSEVKILYYLLCQNPMGDRKVDCRVRTIAETMGMSTGAVSQALRQLKDNGFLPDWVLVGDSASLEIRIRDCLKSKLGGLTEVKTPAGRIDLLTNTEIIEVKNVKDWKAAMGQVLAYSGFYPEHHKRLHLFGKRGEMLTLPIMATCAEFNITVTFEEVE